MSTPIIRNTETGEVYTEEQVAAMRVALEEDTGLDLSTMSPRSVVANTLARQKGTPDE